MGKWIMVSVWVVANKDATKPKSLCDVFLSNAFAILVVTVVHVFVDLNYHEMGMRIDSCVWTVPATFCSNGGVVDNLIIWKMENQ